MPGRILPLVNGQVYHIFNRGIDRRPTFTDKKEYQRAVECIRYYRIDHPPVKLSKFLRIEGSKRDEMLQKLGTMDVLVQILCYCLMPNHFHLLVRQIKDKGISKYMSNYQNSYTRYFNTKNKRDGSLFLDQFKAVRIESDDQLVHVSRYIHLNPYTGYVVKSFIGLEKYSWSSLTDYQHNSPTFIEKRWLREFFPTPGKYKRFLYDQADYQRKLQEIKHLILE